MAFDAFLKIESLNQDGNSTGIEGESTDKLHPGEIQLLSFAWGISGPTGIGSATSGAGTGKVTFQDLNVTKSTDKATPKLMEAVATGKHFDTAVLSCRKAGGGQQDFLTITLSEVILSAFTEGGFTQSDQSPTPTESVSLNFAKIKVEYIEQTSKGNVSPPIVGVGGGLLP